MNSQKKKLLIVSVAAFGWDLLERYGSSERNRPFTPIMSAFPALTCVAQASFRTASSPAQHGLFSNGVFARDLRKVLFWEQSAALVEGRRFWHDARQRGKRVGMLFWQQSLGDDVDLVLSPRPIHKHSGGMIQDCLSQPDPLYHQLTTRLGRGFNLMHFWGPLASYKSSDWITKATCEVMADSTLAPDLLLTYLPHLDYDLQRYGPQDRRARAALEQLFGCLDQLARAAAANDYECVVFGDYAIGMVTAPPVYPNRILRETGLLKTRSVRGMAYPDFFHSDAFAMADHEVALVYARNATASQRARDALRSLEGIAAILDDAAMKQQGLDHPHKPDLLLLAQKGTWFAYPWWVAPREAPDYATHIDIHNKPGYDPCELFFGWPPYKIGGKPERIRGSHGLAGNDRQVACSATFKFNSEPQDVVALAREIQRWLET